MKFIIFFSFLTFGAIASADTYDDFQKLVSYCGSDKAVVELKPDEYDAHCESYFKTVLFFELERQIKKINELPNDISYWFKVDQEQNMRNLNSLYRLKGVLLSTKSNIEGKIESKCKEESDQLGCRVKEYAREIHRNKGYSSIVWQVNKLIKEYSPHSLDSSD